MKFEDDTPTQKSSGARNSKLDSRIILDTALEHLDTVPAVRVRGYDVPSVRVDLDGVEEMFVEVVDVFEDVALDRAGDADVWRWCIRDEHEGGEG